jgi:S1-C subfamily serine protease
MTPLRSFRRRSWRRPILVWTALLLVAATLAVVAQAANCPQCGAPLEPGALFCTRCGHRLTEAQSPPPAATPAADAGASVVQIVATHDEDVTSAAVSLTYGENLRVGTLVGSAFAVAPGEFVTDSGLLAGARAVTLRDRAGRTVAGHIKGVDALIGVGWVGADLPDVPPLRLRTGGLPRLGESLLARGFPAAGAGARGPSSSGGVVSGIHRGGLGIHPIEDYIQTDASLSAGFAGGPVLDAEDRVVGMSTARLIGARISLGESGLGRVVPSDWIARALAWIRAGTPSRPWIGALAVAPDADLRRMHGLPDDIRSMVDLVFPGSPAESAGLRRGDGIVKIQGLDPADPVAVHSRLLEARPGDAWSIDIARHSEHLRLAVTLAARPDRPRPGALDTLRYFGGLEIVAKEPSGLVVTRVTQGSEAGGAGIKPGDILTALLIKKDWSQAQRDDARWRPVHDMEALEKLVPLTYADIDFFMGLRLKSSGGKKLDLFLFSLLDATTAF